jgi:hypothetical protein
MGKLLQSIEHSKNLKRRFSEKFFEEVCDIS